MSWAQAFSLVAIAVAPLWLLMIVAPTWRWTRAIVTQPWSFAPLAVVYAILVIPRIAELAPQLANPQLDTIATLLGTPAGATIAWVHFLVFDAFVGRWIYLDSRDRGVHPLLMAPVLLVVILFGPLGFLAYLVIRAVKRPATA